MKSRELCLYVDYCKLNKKMAIDFNPLLLHDVLDQLSGSTVSSMLDLQSGYYQMFVSAVHQENTAFLLWTWYGTI